MLSHQLPVFPTSVSRLCCSILQMTVSALFMLIHVYAYVKCQPFLSNTFFSRGDNTHRCSRGGRQRTPPLQQSAHQSTCDDKSCYSPFSQVSDRQAHGCLRARVQYKKQQADVQGWKKGEVFMQGAAIFLVASRTADKYSSIEVALKTVSPRFVADASSHVFAVLHDFCLSPPRMG